MDERDIRQGFREQRLQMLALADQIGEDRWHEPALPGERSIHDLLSHLIAWDEWAVGVFEISSYRPLPPALVDAFHHIDDYNARAVHRYRNLSRDDVLSALQASVDRVIASAAAVGGDEWAARALPELTVNGVKGPLTVGRILRFSTQHERDHIAEIEATYGITPNLEQFREDGDQEGSGGSGGSTQA